MKQVINILLKLDKKIEKIRRKYDPYSNKFKPHITLVYPFEFQDQEALISHIKNSIKGIKPFKISLEKIGESFPFVSTTIENNIIFDYVSKNYNELKEFLDKLQIEFSKVIDAYKILSVLNLEKLEDSYQ